MERKELTERERLDALDNAIAIIRRNLPDYTYKCQQANTDGGIYEAIDNIEWTTGFWPGDNFDGKYLHAIAEGSGMIADGEEYYFGERCDRMAEVKPVNVVEMTLEDRGRKAVATVPDFTPYLRFTGHKKDSAWLVTVFNYHPSQDLLARIALPAIPRSGAWHVFSLKDRKAYSTANPADGFLAEVPAGTVRQFEIAEKKRKAAGHIAPEALEK